MPEKRFTSGKIRLASYKASERQLELSFASGTVRIYRSVPSVVWEKLCSSPNPASYWEDRIAEEYPESRGATAPRSGAQARLEALFSPAKPFADPSSSDSLSASPSDPSHDALPPSSSDALPASPSDALPASSHDALPASSHDSPSDSLFRSSTGAAERKT